MWDFVSAFIFHLKTSIEKKTLYLSRVIPKRAILEKIVQMWLSTDPLQEKYPNISTYAYVANNPINAIDPDGKRIYFVGGAANDSDGWNYISRFNSIWSGLGLKEFKRVNATHGKMGDISFVNDFRNNQTGLRTVGGQFHRVTYQIEAKSDGQYQKALAGILKDLKTNPLPDGEQLNLTGYSYGAVLQAHLAIGLTDEGYTIDNLILIGSPTSDDSPLMNTLNKLVDKGKIGKIVRHDIEGDYVSNPSSQSQFLKGGIQSAPIIGDGDNAPHFDLARPGAESDARIKQVGEKLIENGVK